MLYIINKVIDYMHQLCFLYMLNYPAVYTLSEQEKMAAHMQGTVFALARLKIFLSIKNLYHM